MPSKTYSIRIVENSHFDDSEGIYLIEGFATFSLAAEFARRWVRDSLEELRRPNQSQDELRKLWFLFGEDAVVVGNHYSGSAELDFFIEHPATPEERDWAAIKNQKN